MSLKIKTQKGDICPICKRKILGKNMWVRYHVRYTPPIVVLACKYCNFTEWGLRNGITRIKCANINRIIKVSHFSEKFGEHI